MNYKIVNDEKWQNEISSLLEDNREWLETIRSIEFYPNDLNEQIKNLCVEVIKWHELSKECYTLLESLYQQLIPITIAIDGTFMDLKTNNFFNDLEEKFEKVKNNYTNNIKAKRDPNYRPDISI